MNPAIVADLRSIILDRFKTAPLRELIDLSPDFKHPAASTKSGVRFEVVSGETLDGLNDVVRDNETGLVWTRSNVPGGRMTWKDAGEACSKLSLGGFGDWRLPTIQELLSLVDYGRTDPSIDTDFFKCESSYYWASTTLKSSASGCAWVVDFDDGDSGWNSQYLNGFVRAVRVGQ